MPLRTLRRLEARVSARAGCGKSARPVRRGERGPCPVSPPLLLYFIRIVKTGNQKLWIWFGVLSGVGLENKYSMLIFGAGIVFGMLLTPQRRSLTSPWLWIAGAIAFLIFLPNLLWNIQHHFPFLEVQALVRRSGRDIPLGPLAFFAQEILTMLPLTLPIWLAGLWFCFFAKLGSPFARWAGRGFSRRVSS